MPYRVINIYYSVTCYTNHINSTRIQSIASMALRVFPDVALQFNQIMLEWIESNLHKADELIGYICLTIRESSHSPTSEYVM